MTVVDDRSSGRQSNSRSAQERGATLRRADVSDREATLPRWRLLEAAWTQCVKAVPLHLDLLADIDDPWASRRQLIAELTPDADMDGTSSLPLDLAFRCLIDAWRHNPHILSDLRQAQTRGVVLT